MHTELVPAVRVLHDSIANKAEAWKDIIKIGRTHLQDATPLMLVKALVPVAGYDKASKIAQFAMENDLTLKAAALKLGFVTEEEFDPIVDPAKMVKPYVAGRTAD